MAEAVQIYAARDEGRLIEKLFKANLPALLKSAPRTMGSPERLVRIAYSTIVYDDKLRKATQASLMGCVLEALKLGLTIGGPAQEAWIIPFRDSRQNALVATLVVGYQGYRNLLDRGKSVQTIYPRAVHVNDHFSYRLGDDPRIFHDPPFTFVAKEADLLAAYCVATLRGGVKEREVMEKAEIDAHRARSRAKDSGPWVTDYPAMALKTTIRKMAKYLPKSSELLARALDLDERADRGADQEFDLTGITIFDESAPPAALSEGSALDALKARMAGTEKPPAAVTVDPTVEPDPRD
jgi:recombination protein RecT